MNYGVKRGSRWSVRTDLSRVRNIDGKNGIRLNR